jgi:hypothetical protein
MLPQGCLCFPIMPMVEKKPNAGLQLRRAISIQAEGTKPLEKHAIAQGFVRLRLLIN